MYVAKFLALNLELDPPDYSNLSDNPEDVSSELVKLTVSILGQNWRVLGLLNFELVDAKLFRLDCQAWRIAERTCQIAVNPVVLRLESVEKWHPSTI